MATISKQAFRRSVPAVARGSCGRLAALALAAALLPGPAVGQECPTRADLKNGIEIETSDGTIAQIRDVGENRVRTLFLRSGEQFLAEQLHGLYFLWSGAAKNGVVLEGRRTDYNVGVPLADLPMPGPRMRFAVQVQQTGALTGKPYTLAFRAPPRTTRLVVRRCVYDAVEIQVRNSGLPDDLEAYTYILDLGVSFMSRWDVLGFPESYRAVRIERMR